jgi:hypothetical protein
MSGNPEIGLYFSFEGWSLSGKFSLSNNLAMF